MNPQARSFSLRAQTMPAALTLSALLALMICGLMPQARAAEPSGPSPEARAALQTLIEGQARDAQHAAHARNSYTVRSGENLDAIIRRTMPSSPVRIEVLREVFYKVNTGTLPPRTTRPAAGTVLQIPTRDEVMQHAFGMNAPAPTAMASKGPDTAAYAHNSALERRTWVRFP